MTNKDNDDKIAIIGINFGIVRLVTTIITSVQIRIIIIMVIVTTSITIVMIMMI